MKAQQAVKQLEKLMSYVLGRRPDEFGLVPDTEGWVKIKDLLKAVHEEEGWRHIRRAHINEILLTHPSPGIEIEDNLIRAKSQSYPFEIGPVKQPPKLLYTCVRQRAYPVVQAKGVFFSGEEKVVLTDNPDLARRIGKRRDPNPVLLTVRVEETIENGVVYQQVGERMYLADFIPANTFSGPALPKEKKEAPKKTTEEKRPIQTEAGTFTLDPGHFEPDDRSKKQSKKRKKQDWKKARREQRRHKERSRGEF
jgi:putative RNA 2'-phosphotransferase